ncbi:unnamed protein product [Arctia plantaginis]|uniref:Sensory neuron membrane protein 2 n=1 Tax=Arctia plantaginis TaxID=874455 RepID=A0A8S1BJ75_ARCPL|nr:unnamed protein product [Arctia plantaginis]
MCRLRWSVTTAVVGCILVVVSCVISFVVVPNIIQDTIISETVLLDDTIQLERFIEVPFPLNFSVRIWNISNPEEFLAGGVPHMDEIGPYVYRLYPLRNVTNMEEDVITYQRIERFEFDAEASYPLTENDYVSVINVPYHAIIQVAQVMFPTLAVLMDLAMDAIYGEFNSPVVTLPVQQLLFTGIPLCAGNVGNIGATACNLIREIGADLQNLKLQDDGSLSFSVLNYKNETPSKDFEVFRGLNDHRRLGEIITFNQSSYLSYWDDDTVSEVQEGPQVSVCNMINGTDASVYAPLVDTDKPVYALNTDICRSVELRYELDTEYDGVPVARFAANEWFLDNDEGCFCLNVTTGINREDGCLLKGAMELYSCVGAFLVLSYPHFLFADERYKNGVTGLNPVENDHKIFMDLEPNTGTPIRGFKRAQFNIFARAVEGISPTANIPTTLVPIFWVEEGLTLPEELLDELRTRLLQTLRLVDILIPVIIAVTAAIFLLGVILIIIAIRRKSTNKVFTT